MKKSYVIVLTGGIASGKSTVSKYISSKGYEIIDSDELVHEVYRSDIELIARIKAAFGELVIKDNKIDRNILMNEVIEDDDKLKMLNSIVHLRIVELLIKKVNESDDKIIFLDIPLMFEVKEFLDKHELVYDEIWYVYLDKNQQIDRLKKRAIEEGKNVDHVIKIISKQMSSEIKKKLADEIIDNTGNLENTYKHIERLLERLNER